MAEIDNSGRTNSQGFDTQVKRIWTFQEAYDDARAGGNISGMRTKAHTLDDAIAALQVSDDVREQLRLGKVYGVSHIVRLIGEGRSTAEQKFGYTLIEHSDSIGNYLNSLTGEREEAAKRIRGTILLEGADTRMWWTFAPYIFQVFQEQGVDAQEALLRIITWAQDGVSSVTVKPGSFYELENVHLQDLTGLNEAAKASRLVGPYYILRSRGLEESNESFAQAASHRFTEQEARRLVTEGNIPHLIA